MEQRLMGLKEVIQTTWKNTAVTRPFLEAIDNYYAARETLSNAEVSESGRVAVKPGDTDLIESVVPERREITEEMKWDENFPDRMWTAGWNKARAEIEANIKRLGEDSE